MAVTRKIIKRRIGEDGEVSCETEPGVYFDLKDDKKTKYEQGRGFKYRKTIYSYRETSNRRKYEDEPLEVKNPDDENVSIIYRSGVIKSYFVEAGRGFHYMRTKIHFDNSEDNPKRKVRVQRVESSEGAGHVEVERIKSFRVEIGRGSTYQVKQVNRLHEEEEIADMEGPCKIIENSET
jgi:hypothetical protein